MKEHQQMEFQRNLHQSILKNFQIDNDEGNTEDIDKKLNSWLLRQNDVDVFIENLETCKKTFKHIKSPTTAAKGKSVPWWTDTLKITRKRASALRRRYQRTLNNEELREYRKNQYFEGKKKYQAEIRKEKNSWKQYCNTSPNNPWNAAYKLASGKTRRTDTLTMLQKPNG
jgi:hypothetical protein